jgi:hypothetical protein
MNGVDIVFARIGDPAAIVAVSDKISGVKAVDLVMRVNVAQLKSATGSSPPR